MKSPVGENGWSITNSKSEEAWSGSYSNTALDYWEQAIDITAYGDRLTLYRPDLELSAASEGLAYLSVPPVDRVFRTFDISSETPTWTELDMAPNTISFYQLASHPTDENLVAIATKSGVYMSRDKGDSWIIVKNIPFAGEPMELIFDPSTAEGLYLASKSTVYYTDETLEEWIEFDKGLPHNNITKIQIQEYEQGDARLFVTKYGRGMWESPTYHALNNELPFPDFAIHGMSSDAIVIGEMVELSDLTGNSESSYWTIEHEDGEVIETIHNTMFPVITFTREGQYTVSLTATNRNGVKTKRCEQYITVFDCYDQSVESYLYFDGVDDKIVWQDENIGQVGTDSAMTISGWFKFLNVDAGLTEFIISKRSSSTNGIQIFRYTNNRIGVNMRNSNGQAVGYGYCPTAITDSLYHHIALTLDTREGNSQIYIDGQLEQSIIGESKISDGFSIPTALALGCNTKDNNCYLHGCIDDFFIYDKALSGDEILDLYNKQAVEDGLIHSYPMNDATTPNIVYDQFGVKEIDIKGAIYMMPPNIPTPISDIDISDEIKIYPNPCHGVVNIETPYDMVNVSVFSMNGASITSEQLSKGQQLYIHESGQYIITIENNGQLVTKKLIVQ